MTRNLSPLVAPYPRPQISEGRDQIGFWLFILLLFLLPLERLALPFRLQIADLVLVLLTLYGLVRIWHTHQRMEFPLALPIWLILLSSLFATQVGIGDYNRSITAIVQEVYLFTWFIVLANILARFSSTDKDRLMKIWAVIASSQATLILAETILTPGRALGTFNNPNATGAYLSISIFVMVATNWPIWLRSVFGMWLLAAMFATGSLGALFSTVAGLLLLVMVYLIVKIRQATLPQITAFYIGTGLLIALFLILILRSPPESDLEFENNRLFALTAGRLPRSSDSRLVRYGKFWPVYRRFPWGTGPDSAASLNASLHNDYVAFLFERGPVGLMGWLGLVGATLLVSLRTAYRCTNKPQRWQALALGAGFLACSMNALTHEVSHFRQVWVLMVFIFAASYAFSTGPMKKVFLSTRHQLASVDPNCRINC